MAETPHRTPPRESLILRLLRPFLIEIVCLVCSAAYPKTIVFPEQQQKIVGWGTALAWEANALYGSPLLSAQLPSRSAQDQFMDLLFGDPAKGLGLNVARYNIGGGDSSTKRCDYRTPRPRARMEGFRVDPQAPYDWSRDASQRHMLQEAKARGANVFEAFSNSPPWWMTKSGCTSGAARSGHNNLRATDVPAFADYLVTIVKHFRKTEGITFSSLSPLNEPDGTWWTVGNSQEGMSANAPIQESVIRTLRQRLAGTQIKVAGTEANNLDTMTSYLGRFRPSTLRAIDRINTHQYNGTKPLRLGQRAAALHKPVWASEVGCCIPDGRTPIWAAVFMAKSIQSALNDLRAEVWCFWQADWGIIDIGSGTPRPLKQYYAIAQFTRFIRPGSIVLKVEGDDISAALSSDRRRLVVVAVNETMSAKDERIDISSFHRTGEDVPVFRTTAVVSENLAAETIRIEPSSQNVVDTLPPQSVNTYLIGLE